MTRYIVFLDIIFSWKSGWTFWRTFARPRRIRTWAGASSAEAKGGPWAQSPSGETFRGGVHGKEFFRLSWFPGEGKRVEVAGEGILPGIEILFCNRLIIFFQYALHIVPRHARAIHLGFRLCRFFPPLFFVPKECFFIPFFILFLPSVGGWNMICFTVTYLIICYIGFCKALYYRLLGLKKTCVGILKNM